MSSIGDDNTDEVKVFRRPEGEEDLETPQSSQQLIDVKTDVALETDLDPQNTRPNLFGDNSLSNAFASPSNWLNTMIVHSHLKNAILHSPNIFNQFSPTIAALSPNYLMPGAYGAPMMPNLFNAMNRASPMANVTNMTNHLANMSMSMNMNPIIAAQRAQQQLQANNIASSSNATPKRERIPREKKEKNRIKKPCNAFMIFMRENRTQVAKENHCKQSSELNKELGQRWQQMSKEEQQPYFDMANKEREEHQRLYPGWSARDNYAIHKKKKKNRREREPYDPMSADNEQKKCRARFGVDNVEKWCKHCRRKKRCLNVQDVEVSSSTHPMTPSNPTTPSSMPPMPSPMLFNHLNPLILNAAGL